MAIKDKPAAQNNSNGAREYEKAKGFLNIGIMLANGSTTRLISVPLQESNAIQKQIVEYLSDESTREVRIQELFKRLVITGFNPTRSEEEMDLGLGAPAAAASK